MDKIKTEELLEVFVFDGNTYVIIDDGHTRKISAMNLLDYNYLKNKPTINGQVLRDDITIRAGMYVHKLNVSDDNGGTWHFEIVTPSSEAITKEKLVRYSKRSCCVLANNDLTVMDSDDNIFHYTLQRIVNGYSSNEIGLEIIQSISNQTTIWSKTLYVLNVNDTIYEVD